MSTHILVSFHGTSINFRDIFRIVATCNSISLPFWAETFPTQTKGYYGGSSYKPIKRWQNEAYLESKIKVKSNQFSEYIQDSKSWL